MEISDIEPSINEMKKTIEDLKKIVQTTKIALDDTYFQVQLLTAQAHASQLIEDAVGAQLEDAQRDEIHRKLSASFNHPTVGSTYDKSSIEVLHARGRLGDFLDVLSK